MGYNAGGMSDGLISSGLKALRRAGLGQVTGVGDLGFGARIAKTRGRLAVVALISTAALYLGAMQVAGFVRDTSGSVALNLALITGVLLALLVVAFVQAMLVADLTFPGSWRERVILGRAVEVTDDDSMRASIGKLSDQNLSFYALMAALIVANVVGANLATASFLTEYTSHGYIVTRLRSPDPGDRVRALGHLAHPARAEAQNEPLVRDAVVQRIDDIDAEVRAWAIWFAGTNGMFEAAPRLRAVLSDPRRGDEERGLAAEALGRLRNEEGAQLMVDLLPEAFGRDRLAIGLLRGLGLVRLEAAASAIAPLTRVDPRDVRAHAYWALGQAGDQSFRTMLFQRLQSDDPETRCFAAEALKFLVTADDLPVAHAGFATPDETECEAVEWVDAFGASGTASVLRGGEARSLRADSAPIIVGESLREKFLKMVFTAGGAAERDFFATVANDTTQSRDIRALAAELATRIDNRR